MRSSPGSLSILSLKPSIFGPLPCLSTLDRVKQHGTDNSAAIYFFPLLATTFQRGDAEQSLEDGHGLCGTVIPSHICPGILIPLAEGAVPVSPSLSEWASVEG